MDLSIGKTRRRVNKSFRERGVPAKVCGRCLVVMATSAFSVNHATSDGLQTYCRPCMADYGAAWRADHPDRAQRAKRAWEARNPERVREYRRRYVSANLDAYREYSQQWRERNREKSREYRRARYQRNRVNEDAYGAQRRARKAAATIEPFTARNLRHDWEDLDLYSCFFCGGPATPLHVDHFYPLKPADKDAPPGPHALFNLVPACEPCNLSKSNRDPWTFLRESLAERGIDLDACLKILGDA